MNNKACDICRKKVKTPLNRDHDHATGRFRGWLCTPCNAVLGFAHDSTKILGLAIEYIENSGENGWKAKCATCGKEYNRTSPSKKYCSQKCINPDRNCENCGEEFARVRHWQKYCGEPCRWAAFRKRHPHYRPGTSVRDNALREQPAGSIDEG